MPPPTPTPSPTQTVMVNLPADVVNRLTPHESGLSQAWATIIAALIAVAAALIALWGVTRQIRADARTARQDRVVSHMTRAIDVTNKMLLVLLTDHRGVPVSKWPDADRNAFTKSVDEGYVLGPMLTLLGAQNSGNRLHVFLHRAVAFAESPASDGRDLTALANEAVKAMQDELASPDTSKVRHWIAEIKAKFNRR
jgi:hypothetical protein